MITIKTYKKDNNILKISIKGHANYKNYGNDIVCASVSSIALCTVNAIYSFGNDLIDVEQSSGKLNITILKQDKTSMTLLENMMRCLYDIEEYYPSNIKISEEE